MRFAYGLAIAVVGACLVPLVSPNYMLTIIIEALIWGIFAMSLDLLVGYTRLYSFGHVAAYGLGAYSSALLLLHFHMPLPFAITLAVVISSLIATPIAWVCTRTHGVSFAMLTLAFAQLGYAMLYRFKEFTGGSNGLAGIPRPAGPFGIELFQHKVGYFYLVVFCLFGSYLLCRSLVNSPFGSVLAGIRENEAKTRALGYNTRAYKRAIVIASYGFGSLAGALYAPFAGFASPELFFWLISGKVLIMVIVGGAGTLIGPIIGGIFFIFLENQLAEITDLWPLIFGSVFIAFVMLAPQGIWGLVTSTLNRRRAVADAAPESEDVTGASA
jgi:branched-chain amino acid transport system permease protein